MLKVNEIFGPTIQGEGKSAGRQVVFLRTALCNLHCTWCDTPYTWKWEEYDRETEVHEMTTAEVVSQLLSIGQNTKALVVSGGEPLLQQRDLIPVLQALKSRDWWIEVETNGTIVLVPEFTELVDQFNCSPKLANNGADSQEKRERPKAIEAMVASDKANFKFVVVADTDIDEIVQFVLAYGVHDDIYLMPEGKTKEEQEQRQDQVKRLCQKLGFNFTPRLHILKWGTRRGV